VRLHRTAVVGGIVLVLSLGLTACGDDGTTGSSPSGATEVEVSSNVGETPEVTVPQTDPPTAAEQTDVVVGDGAVAAAGDTVTVNYHLVKWSDGSVVESSFESGQPATFPLDGLIKCWQDGLPGLAVGGRRSLICPPDTAYGGTSSPLAEETLVFVIDLEQVA
jgi:peptidylprolyl isomerase